MTGGVLGAGAIESMGQEEDQAGLSQPLGFGAHEVLIDHELRWVVEVAKLGLP